MKTVTPVLALILALLLAGCGVAANESPPPLEGAPPPPVTSVEDFAASLGIDPDAPPPPMSPAQGLIAALYDTNGNNMIEKPEVIAAINDYLFGGNITKADVIAIINLYLFGGLIDPTLSPTAGPPPQLSDNIAPTSVSVVNGGDLGEANLAWDAVAGATYYRVGWMADEDYQRARSEPNGEWQKEFRYSNIVSRSQPIWTVTRLTPGSKYWFIVGSHNAFYGEPAWSAWEPLTLTSAASRERGWEIWAGDQSDSADISADSPTGSYGSRILIYESSDFLAAPPGWYAEDDPDYGPTVVHATDVFPSAFEELGVNVRRLHGMMPQPLTHRYVAASFFGPGVGMVGIIDAEGQCTQFANGLQECQSIQGDPEAAAKLGKALFRTTGPEGSAPSNHMAFFSADGTKLIVANLAAKLLERIDYDAETDTFTFNKAATLDLVGGRDLTAMEADADSTLPGGSVFGEYSNFQPTTTPSGALKEGPGRPNNVVVCPAISSDNQHVYVTFGGGGLFVVDMTTEPMSIVAEYTDDVISAAGCGGREAGGSMYLNAGVSASGAGADDSTFIMYRLPLDYPDGVNPHTVPNTPPVVKFYEEKTLGITDAAGLAARRDAHGLAVSANARYLYQFDRIQNKAEVFDLGKIINDPAVTLEEQAIAHAGTIDLTGSGHCVGEEAPFVNQDGAGYQFNDDPAPDHAEVTPDGRMILVAFRGSIPVTVKHAGLGSCPGFGLVTLSGDGGSTGKLTHVFRTFLPDATGTRNLSDIHAAVVRIQDNRVLR